MGFVTTQNMWDGGAPGRTTLADSDAEGTALTIQAGSNRYLLVMCYTFNPVPEPTARNQTGFPASMTIGGQTVNLVVEGNAPASGYYRTGAAIYAANEATVAAFADGSWSVIMEENPDTTRIEAVWYDTIDQTAGVVDSAFTTDTDTTPTITLTTTSSDLVIGASVVDNGNTVTTSDTERFSVTLNTSGEAIGSEETAAGASTVHEVTASNAERVSLVGLALTPAPAATGKGPLINGGLINNGLINRGLIQ